MRPPSATLDECSSAPSATATCRWRASSGGCSAPRGHSFDVARSGYVNLLQPQDRRSKQPGDTPAAVAARRRLHDRGVTGPLLHAIAEIVDTSPSDIVLDAGCGDGFYLGSARPPERLRCAWRRHLDSGRGCRGAALPRMRVDRGQCRSLRALRRPLVLDRPLDHGADECGRIPACAARRRTPPGRPSRARGSRSSCAAQAAIAWPEPSRHSRTTSRSSISAASPPRPIWTPPPFTTSCFRFTARCDHSRSKRCA